MTIDDRTCGDDPIVVAVRDRPGMTAGELSAMIGADRRDVVTLLHDHFAECLYQDRRYRWWPADHERVGDGEDPTSDEIAGDSSTFVVDHADLANYFLDAVVADARDRVNVAAWKPGKDYIEVSRHPIADGSFALPRDGHADFANNNVRKKRRLAIGAPVYANFKRNRSGWSGFILEPLFTWTIQPGSGEIEVVPSSIAINSDVLASISGRGRPDREEVVSLQLALGLDRPDELPPFDEVLARLVSLNPGWPWVEPMDPTRIDTSPPLASLRSVDQRGIYNRVLLTATDSPVYTRGLETELAEVAKMKRGEIAGSALGVVLGDGHDGPASDPPRDLLEPMALNTEQRAAVASALTERLTVVTGPPGTGKSQVVSAIVVNAAYHGMSVLFASKNNKAVDVVEARVNSLSRRPALLRLGRDHLNALTDYLTSLLSIPTSSTALADHEAAKRQLVALETQAAAIDDALEWTVAIRNRAAELDREATRARGSLPSSLVRDPSAVSIEEIRSGTTDALRTVQAGDRSRRAWLARMFWFAIGQKRAEEANAAFDRLVGSADQLGIETAEPDRSDGSALAAEAERISEQIGERLEMLAALRSFASARTALSEADRVEDLHQERMRLTRERSELARTVWDTWVSALRSRTTPEQQQALGKLKAVATQLSGRWSGPAARGFQELIASVREFLPCWAITSLSVRGRVPLAPATFDLVVIDEASQCDIASALPLLLRAKRAVIIGDPMQLQHVATLNRDEDRNLRARYGLVDAPEWSYVFNSLYDLGARTARSVVLLRDHHRSHRDIIEFSNRTFYDGLLRVATRYDRLVRPDPPTAVRWIEVQGRFERPGGGGGLNAPEAAAVIEELQRLERQGYQGTVGVVTPFRAQANRIQQLATKELSASFIERAQLDIGTAHTFQGDERDVILYSTVLSDGATRGALWFLERNRNLFNVAVTRARSALVVVGDRDSQVWDEVKVMTAFKEYVRSVPSDGTVPVPSEIGLGAGYPEHLKGPYVSEWEHRLYEALYREGIRTVPQVEVDRYRVDLALYSGDRRLDIEVDGERYHMAWDGDYTYHDQLRNLRLLELGWDVLRFWVWEIRDDLDGCVSRVRDWCEGG